MKIKDFCNLLLIASGVLVSCSAVGQQDLQDFFTAIEIGSEHMFDKSLDRGVDPNVTNHFGETALILATEKGREEMVEKLLEKGADPNVATMLGKTPLMIAVEKGYEGILEKLLEKGANKNVYSRVGETPLGIAVRKGKSHRGIVKELLDKGVDPNLGVSPGSIGEAPLVVALRKNRGEIVKELLKKGADPNVATMFGKTPLVVAASKAAKNKDVSIVKFLVESGALFPTEQQWEELSEEAKEIILRNYPGTKEQIQEMMGSWLEGEHELPRDVARIITDEKLPSDIYSVGGTDYPSGSGARNVD